MVLMQLMVLRQLALRQLVQLVLRQLVLRQLVQLMVLRQLVLLVQLMVLKPLMNTHSLSPFCPSNHHALQGIHVHIYICKASNVCVFHLF